MRHAIARLAVAALVFAALAAAPARAADPIFPVNSRLGITPPPGFTPSAKFPGFEYPDGKAAIILLDLPADAFANVEKGLTDEALRARGLTVDSRQTIEFTGGHGIIVAGQQSSPTAKRREIVMGATLPGVTALVSVQIADEARATITDEMVREALKTIVARAQVPDAEKLSVLPYKVNELAGFRVISGGQDGTTLLTDGPEDAVAAVAQPFVLISVATGEMPKPEDRDQFARRIFSSIPGIKEVRIVRAEPQRITGMAGFEILAEAKDQQSNTEVTAVQWIRFGQSGFVQMFAIGRRDAWNDLFPRLRAIRDGVQLR